jgi:ribosomal protein L9
MEEVELRCDSVVEWLMQRNKIPRSAWSALEQLNAKAAMTLGILNVNQSMYEACQQHLHTLEQQEIQQYGQVRKNLFGTITNADIQQLHQIIKHYKHNNVISYNLYTSLLTVS